MERNAETTKIIALLRADKDGNVDYSILSEFDFDGYEVLPYRAESETEDYL